MRNFIRNPEITRGVLSAVLIFIFSSTALASRFLAVPYAETMPKGRYSLWQFGLYEKRDTKEWRSLNRLDLGLCDFSELGIYVISPKNKPPSTWINLEAQMLKETPDRPVFSVGVFDGFAKGDWLDDKKTGPSPYAVLGKTFKNGVRYAKFGGGVGFNRLDGVFGGMDLRFLKDTGLMAEYAPANIRLPKARAWDFGLYHWITKSIRARASWMGGNPMVDIVYAASFQTR